MFSWITNERSPPTGTGSIHVVTFPEANAVSGQRAGTGVLQDERPEIRGRHIPQRSGIVLPRLKWVFP
jgi:hypothetical protein